LHPLHVACDRSAPEQINPARNKKIGAVMISSKKE